MNKPRKGDDVLHFNNQKGKIKTVSKGYAYIDFGTPGYFEPYPISHMELDTTFKQKTWRLK